jgi:hypothetical protein
VVVGEVLRRLRVGGRGRKKAGKDVVIGKAKLRRCQTEGEFNA